MDMGTSQGSLYDHDLAWLASRAVYNESSYIRSWTDIYARGQLGFWASHSGNPTSKPFSVFRTNSIVRSLEGSQSLQHDSTRSYANSTQFLCKYVSVSTVLEYWYLGLRAMFRNRLILNSIVGLLEGTQPVPRARSTFRAGTRARRIAIR